MKKPGFIAAIQISFPFAWVINKVLAFKFQKCLNECQVATSTKTSQLLAPGWNCFTGILFKMWFHLQLSTPSVGSISYNTLREMCLYLITLPKYIPVKGAKRTKQPFPVAILKWAIGLLALYALTKSGFCSNLLDTSKSCVRTSFQGMIQKGYTTDWALSGQEEKKLRTNNSVSILAVWFAYLSMSPGDSNQVTNYKVTHILAIYSAIHYMYQ